MDSHFLENENFLRAVYPENRRPDYWRNGRLSPAAFKDARGASVDRTFDRTMEESVADTRTRLSGYIVSVTLQDCKKTNAPVKYKPSSSNQYHCEIHGSETKVLLSDEQAFDLARASVIQYDPTKDPGSSGNSDR